MIKFRLYEATFADRSNSWSNSNKAFMKNPPEGSMPHPKSPYKSYNLVWVDDKGSMVTSAVIDATDSEYKKQLNKLNAYSIATHNNKLFVALRHCLYEIGNGHIYDDLENNSKGIVTNTHMLSRFSDSDKLVYTKDMNTDVSNLENVDRLTYEVYRPVYDEKLKCMVCHVILKSLIEHKYGKKRYMKSSDPVRKMFKEGETNKDIEME